MEDDPLLHSVRAQNVSLLQHTGSNTGLGQDPWLKREPCSHVPRTWGKLPKTPNFSFPSCNMAARPVKGLSRSIILWSCSPCVLLAQSCPTPCNPEGCCPLGSSVREIFPARILGWIAISFSRTPLVFFYFSTQILLRRKTTGILTPVPHLHGCQLPDVVLLERMTHAPATTLICLLWCYPESFSQSHLNTTPRLSEEAICPWTYRPASCQFLQAASRDRPQPHCVFLTKHF